MVIRSGYAYETRMRNTEVRVYSTEGGEREVTNCGIINGIYFFLHISN